MPSDLDAHSRPRKMPRISFSPVISERRERKANEEEHQSDTVNYLPDECLFEIFRRLPGSKERTKSACVCQKWLFLLCGIRPADAVQRKILPNLNADGVGDEEEDDEGEVDQSYSRILEGKQATDIQLAAIAVGNVEDCYFPFKKLGLLENVVLIFY